MFRLDRARPFGFLKTQKVSYNRASQCFVSMVHPIIPAARNAAIIAIACSSGNSFNALVNALTSCACNAATTDGGMGVSPSWGEALADAFAWGDAFVYANASPLPIASTYSNTRFTNALSCSSNPCDNESASRSPFQMR